MSLKNINNYRGFKPRKLNDLSFYPPTPRAGTFYAYYEFKVDENWFDEIWSNPNEYELALLNVLFFEIDDYKPYTTIPNPKIDILTNVLLNNFGERRILKKYFKYIDEWEGYREDLMSVVDNMILDIKNCIAQNRYKWGNLMKSCLLEFNPLWNVDGTEETTRTLEQDGTITNRKRGNDSEDEDITTTLTSSENDTSHKTGNDRTLTDESTSESHRGTVSRDIDSDNLTTNNLTDLTTYAGAERDTHQSHTTAIESKTTTESETLYTASKVDNTGAGNDNYNLKEFTNRTDTTTKTGTVREQIDSTEGETRNLTDTTEHDNDVTTTYNTTDTSTRGVSSSNVVDRSNVLTHNTDDTETRDLLDTERITHKRTGNIGVTTSTKLLEEFRAYSRFDIVEIVAHDIANAITEGVY